MTRTKEGFTMALYAFDGTGNEDQEDACLRQQRLRFLSRV